MKDPAVASANAYIGPGGPTVTENDGRMFITLKPYGRAARRRPGDRAARTRRCSRSEGITLYMQAAQDITVGARVSKTQYQYTLVDVDSDELDHWAPILLKKLQSIAAADRRRQRSAEHRPGPEDRDQPRVASSSSASTLRSSIRSSMTHSASGSRHAFIRGSTNIS